MRPAGASYLRSDERYEHQSRCPGSRDRERGRERRATHQRAVARKHRVEPVYMGDDVTLNGKLSTLCCACEGSRSALVHLAREPTLPPALGQDREKRIERESTTTHVHEDALQVGGKRVSVALEARDEEGEGGGRTK